MSKIEEHYNAIFKGKSVRVDAVDANGNEIHNLKTDTYYECCFFCIHNEGDELSEQYLLALRHFFPGGYEDGILVLEEPYEDAAKELEQGGWTYARPDKEDGNIFQNNGRYHLTFLFM